MAFCGIARREVNSNLNPYESLRHQAAPSTPTDPHRLAFFLTNFIAAVAMTFICITAMAESVAGDGSPFAFLGGLFCVGPAVLFAIGEWFLFVRKREKLRRPLGFACGAVAAFTAFGFVANVFEAMRPRANVIIPPVPLPCGCFG